MAYPTLKDLAAIALAGLTGAGIAVAFYVSENVDNAFVLFFVSITVVLCPAMGGWLSTRAGNVVLYPAAVLVGLFIVMPAVEMDSHLAFWTINTTFLFGSVACLSFFAGWGLQRLLVRRNV